MEIKELLSYYVNGFDYSIVQKGTQICNYRGKEIVVKTFTTSEAVLTVPSENMSSHYTINFQFDPSAKSVTANCKCVAFKDFKECQHAAAAALYLINHWRQPQQLAKFNAQRSLDSIIRSKNILDVKNRFVVPFNSLSFIERKRITGRYFEWSQVYKDTNCTLVKIEDTKHFFNYVTYDKMYYQEITYVKPDKLELYCDCNTIREVLSCDHIYSALGLLNDKYGPWYFNNFRSFTKEKNELLAGYGVSVYDDEAKDFEFDWDKNGLIFLKKVPSYIVNVHDEKSLSSLVNDMIHAEDKKFVARPPLPAGKFINFSLGYLFNFTTKQHVHFLLQPLAITEKNDKLSFGKLVLTKNENLAYLKELPDEQFILFEQLTDDALKKHLVYKGFVNLSGYAAWQQQVDDKGMAVLREYYHTILKQLWPFLLEQENIYILQGEQTFTARNLEQIKLGASHPSVSFKVSSAEKFITVQLFFTIDGDTFPVTNTEDVSYLFILHNDACYLPENYAQVKLLQQFKDGVLKFPASRKFDVLRKVVMPLKQVYPVDVDADLNFESHKAEAFTQVMVSEYLGQFLMLMPQFVYDGKTVDYDEEKDISVQNEEGIYIIERDKEAEKKFYERLRFLHNSFSRQIQNPFYYVPFADVMKGNWFLHALRQLQEENITVKGMQNLKKFRYNTATPKFQIKTASGVDWFDMQIKISFGNQEVPLRDVQKAIRSGQKVVILGDGTFGMLPEEWLKQYAMLMKMGEEHDGSLRVNKMHFTLIDELHELIDEEAVLQELQEKKQKLLKIEDIQHSHVSGDINAVLRPYQLSGYNWMQTLEELSWGGCLADDMGLGKTLQAICFLQYLKEKHDNPTSLVVCPTSLIYNWESELQKFAPSLKYHIYYGSNRSFSDEHLENYDIIITSYGTMRNDIIELKKHLFHYIILDESQQIKNPDAQVTKAAFLLQSKNRLVLSGTPVQNNTFDLYAQMHFLNPGFLGNKEFFKTNFATPIDKGSDGETASQLRKLIYPFILRRTKEQVATDLPDKTETILWCEMNKEQRAVYDDYKNYYRHQLMSKINESGINSASIYILEGLLRLRQICDSPVLVKDDEVTTTASIKLEELLREVLENTGAHKLLIFSQFTEMLALVRESFTQNKIPYLYLDGSTPAGKRKELVDQFQNDNSVKAFLISLKAGGVGLNLTAADYVYLIDPWWNPAVEEQAIDRTHRIGQTQKVFAYKMICKDTVEEKILQLQQKKKSLSKELVGEEKGFIKKLTKEDVEFLFS